jgi:Uma2 family endonuclease
MASVDSPPESAAAFAPPVVASSPPANWTVADLVASLGGIPLDRIRVSPPFGTATEKDVIEVERQTGRPCELINGTLVEKTVGYRESLIAAEVIFLIKFFLRDCDLGVVLGEAGTLKILPSQVRVPDVCFISWSRFPNRVLPAEPIPDLVPDLAIEVLSAGNTAAEMQSKLHDYFTAGVRLVWYIDPRTRSAKSYTAEDQSVLVDESGLLSGGDVLPGFELPLKELFANAGSTQVG